MASMTGVEGQVILQAVVSRNGTVVATHVLDGHHLLRGAAAKAVKRWRYKPYMVNGRPADVATIVIVDFHLPH
jgi:protein TonB